MRPLEEPSSSSDAAALELPSHDLRFARVLVALGELSEATREVALALERKRDDLQALALLAKIKHIRGELSAAVACWAQIHARTSFDATARLHIASLFNLSQAPARHAGDFIAMGGAQMVRKPLAYLELERAFQLYVGRMPTEARACCRHVAQMHSGHDREVYKLARLSEAWMAEHSGDLEGACALLEQLGREPGFEHDLDRVLTLASLYERIGTPQRLRAAVHVHRFLEHTDQGPHVLGRLAQLHHRLGESALAAAYARRHGEAFRLGMNRVNVKQALAVACRRYLPLERLREALLDDHEGTVPPDGLSSAVWLALAGLRGASEPLATQALERARVAVPTDTLLGRRYAADLDALLGKSEAAIAGHAAALAAQLARPVPPEQAWSERMAIGFLLDAHERRAHEEIRALFRGKLACDAADLLRSALAADPEDARLWRWLSILARLAPLDGGGAPGSHANRQSEPDAFAARAAVLARAAAERRAAVGRVLAAAAYYFVGRPKGVVHELWAQREPAPPGAGGGLAVEDVHGNLTDEMRRNVRNVFVAVRAWAIAKLPHRVRDLTAYRYSFKVTKEDEPSGGVSAALPTGLAFLSAFLQQPCAPDLASSGALIADAHDVIMVGAVGDVEYKVRAAYHRDLRRVLLPAANRHLLERSTLVPRCVVDEMVTFAATFDEAVRVAFGDVLAP